MHMVSNPTSSPLPFASILPPSLSPAKPTSSSSSSALPLSSTDYTPEVGAIFAYEPYILKPFMGLHTVDRPDDPWHHKAFNLHQPLQPESGTFIAKERYKRDLDGALPSLPLPSYARNHNILTPEMLGRILAIKSNFKKNYPLLYKSMMDQLGHDKRTTISVIPPDVPQHVSHRNLELAAAEINPLESLKQTYEEDWKNILETQYQRQKQYKALINSYKNEINFWDSIEESNLPNTPMNKTFTIAPTLETLPVNQFEKSTSFWADPQNTLKRVEEKQPFIKVINKYSRNEPQTFWEAPHETLKTLNEQPLAFDKPQDIANLQQSPWEIPQQFQSETHNIHSLHKTIKTCANDVQWKPSALKKRDSFWADLEASEEQKDYSDHHLDNLEPIFDFDEDFV